MRFGATVPNYRKLASPENLVHVARRSEELGFDSVWVTDHVVIASTGGGFFNNPTTDDSIVAFSLPSGK